MTDGVFLSRSHSGLLIVGVGGITFVSHSFHFLEEDSLAGIVSGIIPPMVVSVVLVAFGFWLLKTDLEDRHLERIVVWMGAGMIGLVAIGYLIIAYQSSHGITLADVEFVIVNLVSIGALGGVGIGYYDASRVMAREQLATERDELEQREGALTRQNERLESFASVVSHDLRNPLTVAAGHLDLLREEVDSDHIEAIDRSLSRMATIIEDVLTLARKGRVVSDAEVEPVSLADIATSCWQGIPSESATIHVDGEATIMADPERLRHVFENLFRNAVQHGGDTVTVAVGLVSNGDGFYVEDDGPGLPPDEDVFEPGYSTSEDGTGIGLAIVKDIVEAHGWEVRAMDSPDGGARFEVSGIEMRPVRDGDPRHRED